MSKILYMIRKPLNVIEEGLLPDFTSVRDHSNTSLLLLEDGVISQHVPNVPMHALSDDVIQRSVTTTVPLLSYQEVVRLLFDVDRVVVL